MDFRIKQYIKQTLLLAQSIVFKHHEAALYINKDLVESGFTVDVDRPLTWRYYKNLAGYYHESNIPVEVLSIDTNTPISFDKETLIDHPATRHHYSVSSKDKLSLIEKEKDQSHLIKTISFDLTVERVYSLEDGDIVVYDKNLVEEQEQTLISDIEKWIKFFLYRCHNSQYTVTDSLYYPSMIQTLYAQLPGVILNLRSKRCNTSEVHSFHIKERLRHFNRIDQFYNDLNLKQRLFLYRNINKINNEQGTCETLEWLIEALITERRLDIKKYDLTINTEDMPYKVDDLGNKTEHLTGKTLLYSTNLNFKERQKPDSTEDITLLLREQIDKNPNNEKVFDSQLNMLRNKVPLNKRQNFPTKVLKTEVEERVSISLTNKDEFDINHWIYLASKGLYNTLTQLTNPVNGDVIAINNIDSIYLYYYLFFKGLNVDVEKVPSLVAENVRRVNTPTYNELESLLTDVKMSRRYIDHLITNNSAIQPVTNLDGFDLLTEKLFDELNSNSLVYNASHDFRVKKQLRRLFKSYYCNHLDDRYDGIDYEEWLLSKGVNLENFNQNDYKIFANTILQTFLTGNDSTGVSRLERLVVAMTSIIKRLSSYTLQILTNTINLEYMVLDWDALRPTRPMSEGHMSAIAEHGPYVMKVKGYSDNRYDCTNIQNSSWRRQYSNMSHEVSSSVKVTKDEITLIDRRINLSNFRINEVEIYAN